MQILVSGSTGLIGRRLVSHLEQAGHEVTSLVRPETTMSADGVQWEPSRGEIDQTRLEGFDAVVHLAGESINQRWNDRTKQRILDSRVKGTSLLAGALAELDDPPEVLISASAVGYYGDRGDTWLEEDAGPGDLFISEVCRRWEEASQVAAENGIRVVNIRTGIVLSTEGGALEQMLPPFKLGVGGHLGSGDQYLSWVTRDDVARIIEHLIETNAIEGPVNVSTPEPVTNKTFTNTLGSVLGRPTVFWVPGVGVRLMFGQMGEELLLASDRMRPTKLEQSGYKWRYPELEPALEHVLSNR
ncbi:TIGR01777 family oxidoreductase [Haladaptatus sp. NG-SE-30]